MKEISLWEILVPCTYNTGKPVKTRHHKEWDKVVEKIAGGLTIHSPTKGKWKDKKSDESHHERMIPVRIACTDNQIKQIADFSARHYKQKAIMVFKVSSEVKIYDYQ
jgi:hypothetical protein